MKILLINYEFPPLGGGAGNATCHIAKQLSFRGHQIVILTSHFAGLSLSEQVNGLTIIRLPVGRRRLYGGTLGEMAKFIVKGMVRSRSLAGGLTPDAVLAFFGFPCGPVAYLASKEAKCPYIISLRGMDIPGFMKGNIALLLRLFMPVTKFLWRQSAGLVVTNDFMKKLAEKTAAPLGLKVNVIPNGVDCDTFIVPKRKPTAKLFRFLYVGRLVPWQKGLEDLLVAFEQVNNRVSWEVVLDVVGDGPLYKELQAQAQEKRIEKKILFHGWVERDRLVSFYQRSHVFVLPTRKDGMANSLLEAMACGLPVVTTTPAAVDLIENGKQGIVVKPGDVDGLVAAMVYLLKNEQTRQAMGQEGMKKAETMSWQNVARSYEKLLQQAVDQYYP